MTTTTKTRHASTDTVQVTETRRAPAVDPTVATRRRTTWVPALRDRRSNRSELARAIAAYPATRSAAAFTLPTPQIAAGHAPAVVPAAGRRRQVG